jgi:hypothetical protein
MPHSANHFNPSTTVNVPQRRYVDDSKGDKEEIGKERRIDRSKVKFEGYDLQEEA